MHMCFKYVYIKKITYISTVPACTHYTQLILQMLGGN